MTQRCKGEVISHTIRQHLKTAGVDLIYSHGNPFASFGRSSGVDRFF